MAEHIIDAFITKFILDRSDFKEGVEEVEQGSKRLRENQRKTFDEIEQAGKKTGESIKTVTREVVGLGLAFMGAKSIVGFIKDMSNGAASADRFGQTLGMSVKQVWAWRQAMKSVGGQAGEGDAALQRIQQIKMGMLTGDVDPASMVALGRLGVGGTDLRNGDAGSVLSKLAGAQGKMNPELYASLLQQIGLPQSTIYFLQQGQAKVDDMLKQFAANADQQENLATETEKLQQSITSLQTTLEQKVAKPLTTIADWINKALGNDQKSGGASAGSSGHWWDPFIPKDDQGRPLWGGSNPSHAPMKGRDGPSSGAPGVRVMGWTPRGADGNSNASVDNKIGLISRKLGVNPDQPLSHDQFLRQDMTALEGRAAGRHNYGNMRNRDGSWRQFSSPAEYVAAQTAWLERRWKEGARTVRDAVEGRLVNSGRGFVRMTRVPPAVTRSGGSQIVNVGPITIHTQAKNASEIARSLPSALRQRGVIIQADRGMTP
jgi:hypothetical protein